MGGVLTIGRPLNIQSDRSSDFITYLSIDVGVSPVISCVFCQALGHSQRCRGLVGGSDLGGKEARRSRPELVTTLLQRVVHNIVQVGSMRYWWSETC